MPTITLTRGIPGSGKSHAAKEWVREDPENRVRVNRDELRQTLYATTSTLLSGEQEKHVSVVEKAIARESLAAGKDVIVDATNLNPRWVKDWYTLGYEVRFRDFPVALDVALARNAERDNPIPEDAIRRMFTRTLNGELPPAPVNTQPKMKPYTPDPKGSG